MSAPRKLLIDATPLRAVSGQRGIGRMLASLLRGLADTRSEWEGELELSALSDLAWGKEPVVSQDLRAVVEEGLAHRGTRGAGQKMARRFRIPRTAAQFDALHLPEILGTPVGLTVPLILTCHDLIPLRYPREYLGPPPAAWVRRLKDRRRYESADHIVCISPRTARDLEEIFGLGAPRVSVAWLGIELDRWRVRLDLKEPLERLGVVAGKYVVYAGYSDYRKNIRGMLAALAYARRAGVELELVWAGQLSPSARRDVELLVAEHSLQGHVRFLGFVSHQDLIALFQGALAHPFLSRLEGFGLSVAEAMAARCPVVVARSSGADDVAGSAALVVDPDVPEEAGRALVRIANEPGLADTLRAAGDERSKLYDYRRMARDYVNVYREVAGRAREGHRG